MEAVLRLGRDSSRLKQLRNAVVALVTFDSFKQLAPAGIRSTEASSRQMTFETHGVEIGVLMRLSEDRKLSLAGQVLDKLSGPIQDPAARVDLVIEGDHIMTSSLSPWGEFVFSDVPKAHYGLQVYVLDRMLQIPSLPSIENIDLKTIVRSEEHTSELQSRPHLVCRLLLEKKKHSSNLELRRNPAFGLPPGYPSVGRNISVAAVP